MPPIQNFFVHLTQFEYNTALFEKGEVNMADDADMANEYIDSEISRALKKLRQQNTKKIAISGSTICKECGDPIPTQRYSLGYQFCVACAQDMERRKSLFVD